MKSDAAIFTAFLNRLAPQAGLPVQVKAANDTSRAKKIREEAEALFGATGIAISEQTVSDLNENLAALGVAIAQNVWKPRPDGSRVDIEVRAWPMEFVRWDALRKVYVTQVDGGQDVEIVHGDGEWIVITQHELEPWSWGALVALGMIWADRAYGIRDRSKAGTSHGNAKMVGELPEGVDLVDADNNLTPQASAFLQLLKDMHGELPAGIRPHGSELEMIVNNSAAWQIFNEIIKGNDVDASRVLLGSDAATKTEGGDYRKSTFLWGVRNDIVERDLNALARGFSTGSIVPWAAVNYGDSENAPQRIWLYPDPDEDARRASFGDRMEKFTRDVESLLKRFDVTQEKVDELADAYGVPRYALKPEPEPLPAPAPQPVPEGAPPSAPEPTALERETHAAKMTAALLADMKEARALGYSWTSDQIKEMAARYGCAAPAEMQ